MQKYIDVTIPKSPLYIATFVCRRSVAHYVTRCYDDDAPETGPEANVSADGVKARVSL